MVNIDTIVNSVCFCSELLWFASYFRICPDYCTNEFLDESSIPIEFEEEIITMAEQLPEVRNKPKVVVSAPPKPKSLNAHRPMNFAHAMKIFKNMQKRKAQASAREKHKVKKVKEKPPQKPLIQVAAKSSSLPKTPSSSKTISKSSRKKKHKSKKSKSVNSSKIASVPKVDEDEIEIDIVDV